MKKTLKSLVEGAIWALMACMAYSCVEKIEQPVAGDQESGLKTCSMIFEGEVIGFSQDGAKPATKAAKSAWEDGDRIYITFYKQDSTKVAGSASYSSTRGWSVTYDGTLAKGTDLACEVRYFVNAPYSNQFYLTLDAHTEVYETLSGTYDYDGNALTVEASMTPKTGRIRFCGSVGDKIYLSGLSTYTKYTASSNAFSSTKSWVKVTVDSTGYTPYVYACFSDDVRNLGVVGSDFAYTKTCTDDVLKVGESGYMTIPSETFYNNWKSNLIINVDGVEFAMVAVSGHSDGFFLIGETEVTKGLYYKLTNDASTTNLNYPISNITYDTFKTAVTQLNTITELEFSLPTKDQWQYASRGGSLSQGYTYSGSNDPEEVAWYSGNSSNVVHPVKQLAPNELGIYDMSGNIYEYTTTLGSSYYYYSYVRCGGSYTSTAVAVTSDYAIYTSTDSNLNTSSSYYGFRLILTCD